MRLLIVAAPCVCCCCCTGSRHYSTSAWHQCLFQFHLIALVIKPGTDTTHHIIALITSELHCVHMTISLAQTSTLPPLRFPPCPSILLSLYFPSQDLTPPLHPSHSVVRVSVQWQMMFTLQWFIQWSFPLPHMQNYSSFGQVARVLWISNSDGVPCGFPNLVQNGRREKNLTILFY